MNIFARELKAILARHGKNLSSLYGLHSETFRISPNKVSRLRRSLTQDITATLNSQELEFLQEWVPLNADGKELLRLHAALVAEAVRSLISGRIERDKASKVGETAFQLLLGREPDQILLLRDELLESIRGGPKPLYPQYNTEQEDFNLMPLEAEITPNPVEEAMEEAIAAYEQGVLWLEVARGMQEPRVRLGYLAQARALLSQARDLVANAPASVQGTPEQQQWLAMIEQARTDDMLPP